MKEKYSQFQKNFYNNNQLYLESEIIGNFDWHEEFPYETQLCFINGDVRKPIFSDFKDKIALDFGCGPGRMIKRMSSIFQKVDGADISNYLLSIAGEKYTNSSFFETNGANLGLAPDNFYDFIYSTIAMQHISSRTIRLNIIEDMKRKLNDSGKITLQMAFIDNDNYFNNPTSNAKYLEDKFDTMGTNGAQDVVIMPCDLENLKQDFLSYFSNVQFWFYDINLIKNNLNGTVHGDYWATHWLFLHCSV